MKSVNNFGQSLILVRPLHFMACTLLFCKYYTKMKQFSKTDCMIFYDSTLTLKAKILKSFLLVLSCIPFLPEDYVVIK